MEVGVDDGELTVLLLLEVIMVFEDVVVSVLGRHCE